MLFPGSALLFAFIQLSIANNPAFGYNDGGPSFFEAIDVRTSRILSVLKVSAAQKRGS